jgi:hypothetical protein
MGTTSLRDCAQKSLDMLGIGDDVPVVMGDDVKQASRSPTSFSQQLRD